MCQRVLAQTVEGAEDEDVRIVAGMFEGLGVVLSTLRVVVGQVADQGQLDVGNPALDQTISVDHTERVFPRIVA